MDQKESISFLKYCMIFSTLQSEYVLQYLMHIYKRKCN